MFMQIIDYFVGALFREDTDLFYKVRLLVGAMLSFLASVVAFGPFYSFIPGLPDNAIGAYFVICIPAVFLWSYLLWLLKNGKAYEFSAHSTIASIIVILFGGVSITGGPMHTEVHPLLTIPSIVAFLLLGKRGGILWSIIIIAIYFIFVGMNFNNYEFINLPPEEVRGQLKIFNWSYAFVTVAALALLYDTINRRIIGERDVEREKYKHVAKVAVESSVVTQSAESMADSGKQLLSSVIQQKTAIEQLATTSEELGATAEQNTQMAADAKHAIKETEQHLLVSKADLLQLVSSMKQIHGSSEEVQLFNNVINDIAFQSNILSLNAMIEASRSAEGSGGFQVVAMEMKNLAERSAHAAEDINKLLETNRLSVEQGVQLSETMQQRFIEMSERITPLSGSIQNISDASFEQNEAIRQIMTGLNDIDRVVEENKELAMSSATTANELKSNATSLMDVVATLGADIGS